MFSYLDWTCRTSSFPKRPLRQITLERAGGRSKTTTVCLCSFWYWSNAGAVAPVHQSNQTSSAVRPSRVKYAYLGCNSNTFLPFLIPLATWRTFFFYKFFNLILSHLSLAVPLPVIKENQGGSVLGWTSDKEKRKKHNKAFGCKRAMIKTLIPLLR